jgi:uncharacterized protein (TIGR00730 family)
MEEKKSQKPGYTPITVKDIDEALNGRVEKIENEFREGFGFIKKHPRSVTFFGSARTNENESDYIQARSLAKRISEELGYSIVTGGGPGIMEAANRGSHEANGESVGFTIQLPMEQVTNPYLTDHMNFHYFFSRKVCLSFSAEAYIYFPGGFGTFDELFEILTLVQTNKIEKVPIILVGKSFWKDFDKFIKKKLVKRAKISPEDVDLYTITDSEDEILEIIRNAPIREGVE